MSGGLCEEGTVGAVIRLAGLVDGRWCSRGLGEGERGREREREGEREGIVDRVLGRRMRVVHGESEGVECGWLDAWTGQTC